MRKMYGQDSLIAGKKMSAARKANRRTGNSAPNSLPPEAAPHTELQRLIAAHLGEVTVKSPGIHVPGIAEHVLPSGWAPIQ